MSISPDLFRAILAMDSYNRGYDLGIDLSGSQIGLANISADSTQNPDRTANRIPLS